MFIDLTSSVFRVTELTAIRSTKIWLWPDFIYKILYKEDRTRINSVIDSFFKEICEVSTLKLINIIFKIQYRIIHLAVQYDLVYLYVVLNYHLKNQLCCLLYNKYFVVESKWFKKMELSLILFNYFCLLSRKMNCKK